MLHGVLLYAVIILYTRLAAVKETEKQQKQILEETENTLAAFLLELKEENEKLIENKASSASQSDEESQKSGLQHSETYQERDPVQEAENLPEHIEGLITEVDRREEIVNSEVQSFEDQVIELYEQGYSASQIAQKMKSGKTKIELFLKFRSKGVKDS